MPTQPDPTDPMLDLALAYAAQGWPVFPCRAADDYDPETGEVLPEKAPLISNGFRGATLSERIIRELWKRNPGALVGIPTGERSGFWVLDVDVPPKHEDGRPWLEHQQRLHGVITTKQAETGSGGLHFLFTHEHGIRNADVATGVETRGEGGYFIAPGSVMEDGRTYRWLNEGPIQRAPQWLLDLLIKPKATAPTPQRTLESAGASEIEEMLSYVSPDCSYQEWVSVLMAVHSALGDAGLAVADQWSSQGRKYRQGEVARKWNGFQSAGGVNLGSLAELARQGGADLSEISRRHRPLQDNDNTRLVDIKKMLERAREKAAKKAAIEPPSDEPELAVEPAPAHPTQPPAKEDDTPFRFTPFSWKDPASLPRRQFAFGKHYIRKYVSVTVAPGGLGKTSNSVVEALSMASGKDLTGDKPPSRLRVWLFNAEDPRDEMDRRIMAACLHYGLSPADIEGHLFLDTGREQELIVMHEDKKAGVTVNVPIVEAVAEQIRRNQVDVLIVDPFVSTHRVNENDNGAIDKVAKLWAQIADDTNCAIDVVHHLRKLRDDNGKEAHVEDARGAVSLIGAARSVRVLNRMSADEATKAGVKPEDRYSYFHIHYGKANLVRMDAKRYWRKLVSVGLGNGGKGILAKTQQDTAGVVTAWKWPSKDEMAEAIPDDVRQAVLVQLGNQNHRESAQADDWAGYVLAEAMGMHLDVAKALTPEKRKVKMVLDAWIENGILQVVKEDDPKRVGRKIAYVRPAK